MREIVVTLHAAASVAPRRTSDSSRSRPETDSRPTRLARRPEDSIARFLVSFQSRLEVLFGLQRIVGIDWPNGFVEIAVTALK